MRKVSGWTAAKMMDQTALWEPAKQKWYNSKESTMQTLNVTAETNQMQKAIIVIRANL